MKLLTQWAVTSSVLILIVLTVRVLFRDKLSARLRYALWGIVLLRLLVPFQVELPADTSAALPVLASNLAPEAAQWEEPSIPVFPERSKPAAEFNLDIETTLEPGDILSYSDGAGCLRRDGETITWYRYILSPEQIVLALWLAGAGLTGTVILLSNLRFTLRLRKRRERLERIDAPVPVYVAEGLPSPCLFGVVRPAVYVTPQAAENPDTLRHVLAHELTHCAHRDHIWSLLRILALALHWYNPLAWLAVILSKRDGELACDEGAIARLGEAERVPYGRTLVDMVAARSPRPVDLLSCSTAMTGGEKSIKRRVVQIVRKPETVKAALFAAVAVVALSVVFVFGTRPAVQGPETSLTQFHTEVEQAVSIQYSPPLISSQAYPDPITDPELLALTKERLSGFVLQDPDTVVTGWSRKLMSASRITLSDGKTESTYALCLGEDGRTYLFSGAGFEARLSLEEGETLEITPIARTEGRTNVGSSIASYARMQYERSRDPSIPVPMTHAELSRHTPEGIWEAIGYRLQGWDGDLKDAEFHAGYTSLTRMQLWYRGGETREGTWVLELLAFGVSSNSSGYSVVSDQPIEVFNAARYADGDFSYETLGPGAFLAFLRSEDVIGVYLARDGAPVYGEHISIRVEEIKELAVQGLYHQLAFSEYDADKYDQYALVLAVGQKLKTYNDYEIANKASRITLSIGQEPDVVCLSHWLLSVNSVPMRQFVYSPELYRAIQALCEPTPGQMVDDRQHAQSALLGDLTQAQVDRANEALLSDVEQPDGSWGPSEISCFFTSSYDDPTQIDLKEFLAYCPIGISGCLGEEDAEEFRAVIEKDGDWDDWEYGLDSPGDLPVPTHRYPRAEVSALLQKYAGVIVEELDWSNCLYVEEYDAFYNFTSDYGPGFFPCAGGRITGDTVLLWSEPSGDGGRCELTLRKSGENWLIQSHHTIYER